MKFFYETVDSANFERGNSKLFVDKYSKAYFDDYPRNDAKLEKHIIKKCEKGVDMGLTLCYDILESRV